MNSFKTLILVLTVGDSMTNALTHYRPKNYAGFFRSFMLKAREERQETATVTAGTWTGMLWASAPDASILVPVESITSIITQTRTTALGTLTESIIVTPTVFVRPSNSWAPGSRTSLKPSTSSLPSSQQSEETQQPTPDPTNLFAPATPSSSRSTQKPTASPTTGSITTSSSQTPTVLSSSTSSKGLSPGAKAGLGVGVTLGVVALLGGLIWALRTRRRISTLEQTIQFSPASRGEPAPVPPPKYPPRDYTANAAIHGMPQNGAALWRVSRVGGGKEMEGTRYEKVVNVDDNEEHMGPPIPRKSSRRSSSVRPISPVPESFHTHPNIINVSSIVSLTQIPIPNLYTPKETPKTIHDSIITDSESEIQTTYVTNTRSSVIQPPYPDFETQNQDCKRDSGYWGPWIPARRGG